MHRLSIKPEAAGRMVEAMRAHPLGAEARTSMRTVFRTTRIVDMQAGDQLPRVC